MKNVHSKYLANHSTTRYSGAQNDRHARKISIKVRTRIAPSALLKYSLRKPKRLVDAEIRSSPGSSTARQTKSFVLISSKDLFAQVNVWYNLSSWLPLAAPASSNDCSFTLCVVVDPF
jgi:hypothetical protein